MFINHKVSVHQDKVGCCPFTKQELTCPKTPPAVVVVKLSNTDFCVKTGHKCSSVPRLDGKMHFSHTAHAEVIDMATVNGEASTACIYQLDSVLTALVSSKAS